MNTKTALTIVAALVLQACGSRQSQENQSQALQEEMRSREITRVSPGQLTDKALQLGNEISASADSAWLQQLKPVMAKDELSGDILACSVDAVPAIAQLNDQFGLHIRKVSLHPINPANKANALETELADAYQYNLENNIPLSGNVQNTDNAELLYTRAIVFSDPGCMKCHGNAEATASKAKEAITATFKASADAFNNKPNQLAGMWSIVVPKKEIIRQLSK